jgi:hypothetical protein
MAQEKQFENKVKAFLKSYPNDIWFFKHWAGAYSQSGIPDIIACVNGHFVGIEVKAEDGHPSPLQIRNIELIQRSKGHGYILYPKDFEQFKQEIRALIRSVERC